MTKITFYKTEDGIYYGFRESGHSGYEDAGKDIVCAAISAMTMLIINTVEVAHGSSVDYKIDEETTFITVKCPSALPESGEDEKKRFAASGLIRGYFYQLNDLTDEYHDFLDICSLSTLGNESTSSCYLCDLARTICLALLK